MYRETFERLNILHEWRGSVSDDYSITNAAHRSGTKIVFVPECLIPTHGESTWKDLLEFTTRQIVITRVYLKQRKIKFEVGIAKGKKLYDKRETEMRKIVDRETRAQLKERNR